MHTFSRVIARPGTPKTTELDSGALSQPATVREHARQGLNVRGPDPRPLRTYETTGLSGYSLKPVWWKDPGFFSTRGIAHPVLTGATPPVARDLSLSPPPFVPPEGGWTESSSANQSLSSSPELPSPPQTACSTIAVLGSAGLNRTFEDDYDRCEANPNFVRNYLRWSRSLRRQARMRDGDFRRTDDERDYSVSTDPIAPTPPKGNASHVFGFSEADSLAPGAVVGGSGVDKMPNVEVSSSTESDSLSSPSSSVGLSSRGPSRLSLRVRPPPPIDTHKKTLRNGDRYLVSRVTYKVEDSLGYGAPRSLPSDSGFDADDEEESPAMLPVRVERAPADEGPSAVVESTQNLSAETMPTKKTYASVVAASPPRGSRPASRLAVVQTGGRMEPAASVCDWRPFVEPLEV